MIRIAIYSGKRTEANCISEAEASRLVTKLIYRWAIESTSGRLKMEISCKCGLKLFDY